MTSLGYGDWCGVQHLYILDGIQRSLDDIPSVLCLSVMELGETSSSAILAVLTSFQLCLCYLYK